MSFPKARPAPIEWKKVTKRSFTNILKKFNVTVTKTDAETGNPQGDATLAAAVYGIYKGEELIDTPIPRTKMGSLQQSIISAATIGAYVKSARPRATF